MRVLTFLSGICKRQWIKVSERLGGGIGRRKGLKIP